MNKYTALNKDVYDIFASNAWKAEAIKTIPDNYATAGLGNEFIRVSIIPAGGDTTTFPWTASGQLIIDIFTPAGDGMKRQTEIADTLDRYLVGKTFSGNLGVLTQTRQSSYSPLGLDKANASLYRGSYSLSFTYFGN